MADLDGLKRANDTYGHLGGNVVLQMAARRFLRCVRDCDTLARLGGDEICVVLPRTRNAGDAEVIATRLLGAADGSRYQSMTGTFVEESASGSRCSRTTMPRRASGSPQRTRPPRGEERWKEPPCHGIVAGPSAGISLPLIAWIVVHDVGVAMSDEQNRKLAGLLNDLSASLSRGDDMPAISAKLASALSFAVHHFECGERLMDEHGFAEVAAHLPPCLPPQ